MEKLFTCIPTPGKTCPKSATYNVWFEKCGGLYASMCSEHTAKAIMEGVNGYGVYQITQLTKDSQYPLPPGAVKGIPMQPEKFDSVKAYNESIIRDITRRRFSPVHILATLAWISVFTLAWLLILRLVPGDGLSWSFFAFFVLVALFASALAAPKIPKSH